MKTEDLKVGIRALKASGEDLKTKDLRFRRFRAPFFIGGRQARKASGMS